MKRRRNTLTVLLAVFAVMAAAYAAITFFSGRTTELPDEPDPSVVLYTAASFSEISYTYKDAWLNFLWDSERSLWYSANNPDFPLNSAGLTSIVISLKNLTALRLVDEAPADLAAYGLETPQISVAAVTGEGETLSFQIGDENPATGDFYFRMDGSPEVYLLAARTAKYFTLSLNDRAELAKLPKVEAADVSEFTFSASDGRSYHFVYLENGSDTVYTDAYQWFLKQEDGTLVPMFRTAIGSLLDQVLGLSLTTCLDYNPPLAAREFLGLGETPAYEITYTYTATYEEESEDPEQPPRTYTKTETASVSLGAFYDDNYLCAKFSTSDMIGLIEGTAALLVLQMEIETYYPNDLCLIRAEELTAFTVQAGGQRTRVEIDRAGEQPLYLVNGVEAESETMTSFLTSLLSLTPESTAPTDPGRAAALAVTFERDRATFGRMTLELVPYDSNFYLVRFNDRNDQLVGRRGVETLLSLAEQF